MSGCYFCGGTGIGPHPGCLAGNEISGTGVTTPYGLIRARVRDGETVWQLECPGCKQWADLDDDQAHGRVSVDHTDTGCTYHETHDFLAAQEDERP